MESDQIICIKKRQSYEKQCKNIEEYTIVDCTSHNSIPWVREQLSPLWLGPTMTPDGYRVERFENLWQYSKVYSEFADAAGDPTDIYFKWRNAGYANDGKGVRFPFGKPKRPLYSLWFIDGEYKKLGYIEARKVIYIPEYAKLVVQTKAYQNLKRFYDTGHKLALLDFDAYNNYLPKFNMSMVDVFNNQRKAGHGFVLKLLLEGDIEVVDGQVVDRIGVLS